MKNPWKLRSNDGIARTGAEVMSEDLCLGGSVREALLCLSGVVRVFAGASENDWMSGRICSRW